MSKTKWVCAVPLAACHAACAATPETGQGAKENTGTAIGAVTGALIGSQFGGNLASHLAAGVAGAAIGGLIGNRIGASMDEEDKKRAYAAQMQALEGGQSGAAAYQQAGNTCRQYTHTIYIDGKPQTARGAACRNPDGTWNPIS